MYEKNIFNYNKFREGFCGFDENFDIKFIEITLLQFVPEIEKVV
jgi:hypothetical protein